MRRLSPLPLAHWLLDRFDDVHGTRVVPRAALYGVDVLDPGVLEPGVLEAGVHEPAAARTVFVADAPDVEGGESLVEAHLATAADHDAAVLVSAMWVGGVAAAPRPGAFVGRRRARVLTVVCDAGGVTLVCTPDGEAALLHGSAPVPGSAALLAGWHAARAR